MVKLCFCIRRLPHLSREEFLTYWSRMHPRAAGPDAARALGMRRYVQVRALPESVNRGVANGRPGLEPAFDGIAEVWLDSVDAYERAWASPKGAETMKRLMDDEKNFIDWSRSTLFLAEEHVLIDETNEGSTMPTRPTPPTAIDDYIADFEPRVRTLLNKVREAIRRAVPDAEEVISYRMPAFKRNGVLLYFAAFKDHIGLYPPVKGDAALMKAIRPYAGPKGNLKFPLDQSIPYGLITKIAKTRRAQDIAKAEAKNGAKTAKRTVTRKAKRRAR